MNSAQLEIVAGIFISFFGALLALVSLGFTALVGRVVRRKIQHYNSLVILETQLNEMIGIIKDNIFVLPAFKETIQKGNIYWSLIRTIPIDKSHLQNLSDIELINDVFEFFYKIRKNNDDTENLTIGYNELKNAYIEKNISLEHYVKNGIILSQQLDLLEDFQENLSEDLIDLLAKVRIQIRKDKPLVVKIQEFFNKSSSENISLRDFKKEKEKSLIGLKNNLLKRLV